MPKVLPKYAKPQNFNKSNYSGELMKRYSLEKFLVLNSEDDLYRDKWKPNLNYNKKLDH